MGVAEVFTEFGDIYLQSVISTWLMTAVCFAGGLTLGIIITVLRVSPIKPLRTVGLSFTQIIRLVVIPQSLRTTVLPMTNLLIATLLTTAMGSQVPLTPPELTGMVNYVNSRPVAGISAFVVSAICYAGTSVVLGFLGNRLDKKVRILR